MPLPRLLKIFHFLAPLLFGSATTAYSRGDAVDAYLSAQMKNNHIPGLAVAVVNDGRILKLKGYGQANLEWKAMVSPDTEFQLASTTKTLTGSVLMVLVQRGILKLDDPIAKYLPATPESWRDVTLRNLATHTSGIPDAGGPVSSVAAAVTEIMKQPLLHPPGEKSGYNSGDFVVLTAILERVTGKSYVKLIHDEITARAGMSETRFDMAEEHGPIRTSQVTPGRSSIYLWDGDDQNNYSFLFPVQAYAAGGIYSSARDLARMAEALDRGRIVGPAAQAEMWKPQRLNGGAVTSWGVGWVVRTYEGRRVAGHSGGPALSDVLRFVDDKLTVIVLQNQERMYPYLAQGVADCFLSPRPKPIADWITDPDPITTLSLRKFVEAMGDGKFDSTLFAAGESELQADVRNLLVPYARSLSKLQSFRLKADEHKDGARSCIFAAGYGRKRVEWLFDLDSKGKITGMNVQTP